MGARKHNRKIVELLQLPAADLKRKLANGKDFSLIMKFFFDRFVDEPKFMIASHPIEVPKDLADAVGQVFASIHRSAVPASSWRIGQVSLLNLIHGTITTDDGPAVIVWATDIAVGLLGMPNLKTRNTMFARISVSNRKNAPAN